MARRPASTVRRRRRGATRAAAAEAAPRQAGHGVRIRMYRLGVGDCFLVRIAKPDGGAYAMLIDCGVHQSQQGGGELIRQVVADVKAQVDGKLDLIVATHEHWDHISGFDQASDEFADVRADAIWLAWTENDQDADARGLAGSKYRALTALSRADARMRLAGVADADNPLSGLLGFYGPGGGVKLAEAGRQLKRLSDRIEYRQPGEPPIELAGGNARAFVLGPPRSRTLMKRDGPSRTASEVYGFGAYGMALDVLEPALGKTVGAPFDDRFALPLPGTASIGFFQRHYWQDRGPLAPAGEREDTTQDWRRIDLDWLDAAASLALKLDADTNNTSLVLAIELGPPDRDGPVLLFAADAQVGNWLSWQDVVWENVGGRRVTGPDLLRRTMVYKVGHHASHNATLQALGLEQMEALALALVPTDAAMAAKIGWGTLPWQPLLDRLQEKTGRRVLRSDADAPARLHGFKLTADRLFYEIEL
jgi:hypothetical protein